MNMLLSDIPVGTIFYATALTIKDGSDNKYFTDKFPSYWALWVGHQARRIADKDGVFIPKALDVPASETGINISNPDCLLHDYVPINLSIARNGTVPMDGIVREVVLPEPTIEAKKEVSVSSDW